MTTLTLAILLLSPATAGASAATSPARLPVTTLVRSAYEALRVKSPVARTEPSTLSLEGARVFRLKSGSVVHLQQTYRGVPVWRAGGSVLLDRNGRPVRTTPALAAFDPIDIRPRLTPEQAVDAALGVHPPLPSTTRRAVLKARNAHLVIYAIGRTAAPVWIVPLPGPGALDNYHYLVQARSGKVIWRYNHVFHAKGRVYASNPVRSPTTSMVELKYLDSTAGGYLKGKFADVRNCTGSGQQLIPGIPVYVCKEEHKAKADATTGDYDFKPDEMNPEDEFAEVMMYHHMTVIHDFFKGLEPNLTAIDIQLRAWVNARLGFGSLPLRPFDNALYFPASESPFSSMRNFDSIIFGQGTGVDFSYDADVIYHEYTHFVVNKTIKLGSPLLTRYGYSSGPAAVNEALADIFSACATGDPDMGDHVGRKTVAGKTSFRSLADTNPHKCPTHVTGESHHDSLPVSIAAWEIRKILGADKAAHGLLLKAMLQLPKSAQYGNAAAAFLSVTPADKKAAVQKIIDKRGLVNCLPFVQHDKAAEQYVQGRQSSVGYTPAAIQHTVEVKAGVTFIKIAMTGVTTSQMFQPGPLKDTDIAFRKGQPIEYGLGGGTISQTADFVGKKSKNGLTICYPEQGKYYFQIINRGSGMAVVQKFGLTLSADPVKPGECDFSYRPLPEAVPEPKPEKSMDGGAPPEKTASDAPVKDTGGKDTADVDPVADRAGDGGTAVDSTGDDDAEGSGCSCFAAPSAGSGVGAFLICLLFGGLLRRRRSPGARGRSADPRQVG